jgi:DhnA family fructose-bisphosphate aldolase class Ia
LPSDPSPAAREIRRARLFGESGHALIVAWAHGPLLGPIDGVEGARMEELAEVLAPADGILASPSMMPALAPVLSRRDRPMLFMLQHWQSVSRPRDLLGYDEGATAALCSVEDAARWGADGVMTYLYVGWRDPERERREIEYVADVTRRCRDLGLLHMVESRAVRDENDEHGVPRADLVLYHTRLAAELGADLVKTKWPGSEAFPAVADGAGVPVLLAGGARTSSLDEALEVARATMASGAHGLVWGRNIYQAEDPAAALAQVLAVVHGEDDRG